MNDLTAPSFPESTSHYSAPAGEGKGGPLPAGVLPAVPAANPGSPAASRAGKPAGEAGFADMVLAIMAQSLEIPGMPAGKEHFSPKENTLAKVTNVKEARRGKSRGALTDADVDDVLAFTPKQAIALERLLEGANDAEAALAAGVSRSTVTKWRLNHPGFQMELSRRRREIWDSARDRVRGRFSRAIEIVDEHLASDDSKLRLRAAAILLRMAGRNQFAPPDEPADVAGWLAKRARERVAARGMKVAELSEDQMAVEKLKVLEEMRNGLRCEFGTGSGATVPASQE